MNINNTVRGGFQSGCTWATALCLPRRSGLHDPGLAAVLDAAFGDLGLHRVEANIQPANQRSIRLARRLGFEKEGISPGYLIVDGKWRDHERWAIRAEICPPATQPAG